MQVQDLRWWQRPPPPNTLTLATDTRKVSAGWLLHGLARPGALMVTFVPLQAKRAAGGPDILDLSGSPFQEPLLGPELLERCRAHTQVLLHHPDLLLAAGHGRAELISFVQSLLESLPVVVSLWADSEALASPLRTAAEQNLCLHELLYQTDLALGVREFPSGHARDYTGLLQVSAGPRSLDLVQEQTYLYTVEGAGGVRLEVR